MVTYDITQPSIHLNGFENIRRHFDEIYFGLMLGAPSAEASRHRQKKRQ
jgi:hypothetical protein